MASLPTTVRRLSTGKTYENIIVSRPENNVTLLTLNRPKALNALNSHLIAELNEAMEEADADQEVAALVLTGSDRAFAGAHVSPLTLRTSDHDVSVAGADIKEMKNKEFPDAYSTDFLGDWLRITKIRKPVIAAVSGYAVSSPTSRVECSVSNELPLYAKLGGGCELAMMCDIILASPTATFGQPEINLGIIPGAGGTQRLTRVIGKSRAMEAILTGMNITAEHAAQWGLVSRVVAPGEGEVVREAIKVASRIGTKGRVSVQAAKETVNAGAVSNNTYLSPFQTPPSNSVRAQSCRRHSTRAACIP